MNKAIFANGPRSPLLNRTMTAMLQALILPNPADGIRAVSPNMFQAGVDEMFVGNFTQRHPTYWLWASATDLFMGFSGMQNISQTLPMIASWTRPPDPPTVTGVCSVWENAWRLIFAENPATLFANKQNVYLVGHSYGGAVACAAAVFFSVATVRPNITLITYGAPRVGTFQGAQFVSRNNPTRWWLTADPVPYIPPWPNECESLAAVLPTSIRQGFGDMTQCSGGWEITATGDISSNNNTSRRVPRVWLSVGQYLSGSDAFFSPNHAIGVYNAAFAAAVAQNDIIPPDPPQPPPQPPPHNTPAQIRRILEIGEAVIEADATNPQGVTRNYAPPPVTDPSAPSYRAARDGHVWVIKLGDEIVCAATGKRAAKVLARKWNRSARAALRMSV